MYRRAMRRGAIIRQAGIRQAGMRQVGIRQRVWGLALACVLVLAATAPAWADLGDYRCTDPGRVYFGNPRLIRTPAVVSADRIYGQIKEYQQILREGLTSRDVRYHFLMKKASKKFAKAIQAMARGQGHNFLGERGAIRVARKDAPPPPDRTSEVISKLGS